MKKLIALLLAFVMCFALMTNVGVYYATFFFTNVAKMSLGAVALITSATAMIDALTSWIYGAIINSTKPMKWGRYRSWLIVTMPLVLICYFFQYVRIGKSETVAIVFFMIFQLGARFFHNFPYIANVNLINVCGKTPDERVLLASNRATWNNMAKFAWSYLGVPFLAVLTGIVGEKYNYATLSLILAALMAVTYFAHFKMSAGYEDTGAQETANVAKAKRAKTNVGDLVKSVIANPPLLCLLLADLGKWLFNFIVAGTVVYYFTYIALNPGLQAGYSLAIAFCAVIGAYISRHLGKKLSGRLTVIVCYIFMAACLLVARMFYTNVWMVIILVSAAQLGYGVCYSCSSAMYADTAVYAEWKTGKNASGWIMGLTNIPLKVGSMLKASILAACLAAAGFDANIPVEQASVAVKEGICTSFMVVPAALLIVGALLLIFGFRLPKEKVIQMQKEIDERKAQEEAAAV